MAASSSSHSLPASVSRRSTHVPQFVSHRSRSPAAALYVSPIVFSARRPGLRAHRDSTAVRKCPA